jgi:hypothetical protein
MAEQDPFASITTTPAQALELLQRLAEDEELRVRLREQPVEVFREYGIAFSAELVPTSVELPSVEELAALAEALQEGSMRISESGDFMLHPFMFILHPWLAIVASIANRGRKES